MWFHLNSKCTVRFHSSENVNKWVIFMFAHSPYIYLQTKHRRYQTSDKKKLKKKRFGYWWYWICASHWTYILCVVCLSLVAHVLVAEAKVHIAGKKISSRSCVECDRTSLFDTNNMLIIIEWPVATSFMKVGVAVVDCVIYVLEFHFDTLEIS